MKKAVLLLFLLFLVTFVHAIEITETPISDQQTLSTISSMQQDLKKVQIKVDQLPDKADVDSSFLQLDQKITSQNQSSSFSSLSFMIVAMIMNDVIVFGLFIFAKTKGVL